MFAYAFARGVPVRHGKVAPYIAGTRSRALAAFAGESGENPEQGGYCERGMAPKSGYLPAFFSCWTGAPCMLLIPGRQVELHSRANAPGRLLRVHAPTALHEGLFMPR